MGDNYPMVLIHTVSFKALALAARPHLSGLGRTGCALGQRRQMSGDLSYQSIRKQGRNINPGTGLSNTSRAFLTTGFVGNSSAFGLKTSAPLILAIPLNAHAGFDSARPGTIARLHLRHRHEFLCEKRLIRCDAPVKTVALGRGRHICSGSETTAGGANCRSRGPGSSRKAVSQGEFAKGLPAPGAIGVLRRKKTNFSLSQVFPRRRLHC